MIFPNPMDPTLERFASACHEILKADPGPAGRRQICSLLEGMLKDQGFLTAHLTETTPERKILYEDPELHSPRRAGPTALIRIEGLNMDKIRRLKFEPA